MGKKLNIAAGATAIFLAGAECGDLSNALYEGNQTMTRQLISKLGSGVAPLAKGIAENVEDLSEELAGSDPELKKRLKDIYEESRADFALDNIETPKLLTLIRTDKMEGRWPTNEIPLDQVIKAKKEKVTLFLALAFPKGEQKVPITIRWERNGQEYDRKGDEYAGQGHRYRLHQIETFPFVGTWTIIIESDGEEIGRQDFKVERNGS